MNVAFSEQHPHGAMVGVQCTPDEPSAAAIARLHPEERAHLEDLRGFRRGSWVAGRIALANALKAAGGPATAIMSDDRGAPIAPPGFVVSVSHKPTIAVALAAEDTGWRVGVDVEQPEPDRRRIASKILREVERMRIDQLDDAQRWPAILTHFSIKECVYKAIDPFVRRYVAFEEAELVSLQPGLREQWTHVRVRLHLANGEGPFEVETSCRWGQTLVTTARIRSR